jgi:hypothetical protein
MRFGSADETSGTLIVTGHDWRDAAAADRARASTRPSWRTVQSFRRATNRPDLTASSHASASLGTGLAKDAAPSAAPTLNSRRPSRLSLLIVGMARLRVRIVVPVTPKLVELPESHPFQPVQQRLHLVVHRQLPLDRFRRSRWIRRPPVRHGRNPWARLGTGSWLDTGKRSTGAESFRSLVDRSSRRYSGISGCAPRSPRSDIAIGEHLRLSGDHPIKADTQLSNQNTMRSTPAS